MIAEGCKWKNFGTSHLCGGQVALPEEAIPRNSAELQLRPATDAPSAALPVHRNRVVGPARLARVTQVIEEEGEMLRAIERRLLNFVRLLQQIVGKHPQAVCLERLRPRDKLRDHVESAFD